MIQLVWLTIGFQIFMAFILSYKSFILTSQKLLLQVIEASGVQVKWLKNKLQQQQVKKKERKKEIFVKAWLKRRKNFELYGTLLVELRLEQEYNYNILLRMTSEHFEEIFQLIKDDILKENTSLRELILPRL